MANRLKMAKIEAILGLYERKWSVRRIAKELGIHRDTVCWSSDLGTHMCTLVFRRTSYGFLWDDEMARMISDN